MHFQLRKCTNCNRYTLKNNCSTYNESTIVAHPSKFSPDDKYLRYRIAERYKNN